MSISYPRPISNVVLLPCRTQLLELYSTLARTAVARQGMPCHTAVARLGFNTIFEFYECPKMLLNID